MTRAVAQTSNHRGNLCNTLAAHFWEEALTASTSLFFAQLPIQQLGVLLRSTGAPLSPLCVTLWFTCRSANPLACCPTELMKETRWGLVREIRIRDLLMSYSKGGWPSTSKTQSRVKSGNISLSKHLQDQRPVRTILAVLLRSPSALKDPLLPLISTQLWLASEGRQLGDNKENHLMLQHIRLIRKPMWLQTAMLLTAQLCAMICLLSVGFGRGGK